jgi:hypothetical protein
MRRTLAIFMMLSLATPTLAQQTNHRFSLYVSGIKAGTINTITTKNGHAFSVSGTLTPTRLMRSIRKIGYNGQSAGVLNNRTYRKNRYSGQTQTGSRTSQVQMRFDNGTPSVDAYLPERENRAYDIDPTAQHGTIDPLTAAAVIFDDQPTANLCNRTIPMFDGRRRSKLSLGKPQISGEGATCNGAYTRIAGFSPQDMQERVNFPVTLVYTRIDAEIYRLMSFTTKTTFGSARAKRK